MTKKLHLELSGILNWAFGGLAEWRENGLGYPEIIRTATEGYRAEMDVLKGFLDDVIFESNDGFASSKYLWQSYNDWCQENGEKSVGQKTFSRLLIERGYERGQFGSNRTRGFKGMELLPEWPKSITEVFGG